MHQFDIIDGSMLIERGASSQSYPNQRNVVFVRGDGIIYKAYRGDQNSDTIRRLREKTEQLAQGLRAKRKSVLILVDLSKLGKTTLSARKEEIEFIRSLDFDKAAVFGENFLTRSLVRIIVVLSGREYKIKFFDSESQAVDWLGSI